MQLCIKGKYKEAEQYYTNYLAILTSSLGEDHPKTLSLMNNLGRSYHEQGLYDKAFPLYESCLALRRIKLGEDHPNTLNSMNNLASLFRSLAKYDEAESLLNAWSEG